MGQPGTLGDVSEHDARMFTAMELCTEQNLSLVKACARVEGVTKSPLARALNSAEMVARYEKWRRDHKAKALADKKAELVMLVLDDRLTVVAAASKLGIHRSTASRWLAEPVQMAAMQRKVSVTGFVGALTLDDAIAALFKSGATPAQDDAIAELMAIGMGTGEPETKVKALKAASEARARIVANSTNAIKAAGELGVKRMAALRPADVQINNTVQAIAGAKSETVVAAERLGGVLGQVAARIAQKVGE